MYSVCEIPREIVDRVGKTIQYLFYLGKTSLSGADFEQSWAWAIGGEQCNGRKLEDVIKNKTAWSAKTIKKEKPFDAQKVRVIAGRMKLEMRGIDNCFNDVQFSGDKVLEVWNDRVRIAKEKYNDFRTIFLLRDDDTLSYTLWEDEIKIYNPSEYKWVSNGGKNFEAYSKFTGKHCFTWQSGGGQFTIFEEVPKNAYKFTVPEPPFTVGDVEEVSKMLGFSGVNFKNQLDNYTSFW